MCQPFIHSGYQSAGVAQCCLISIGFYYNIILIGLIILIKMASGIVNADNKAYANLLK